jgi:hypothetical protein
VDQRYFSGDEIHVRDQVAYNNQHGRVVVVVDRDEYSPDFPKCAYGSERSGFMIKFENGALLFLGEPDRYLSLLARAPSV